MDLGAVAIIAGLAVCMVVAVIPAIRLLIAQRPRPFGESDGGSSEDGGGGLRRPPSPSQPPGSEGPAWWPEFEREFARHVAELGQPRSPSSL